MKHINYHTDNYPKERGSKEPLSVPPRIPSPNTQPSLGPASLTARLTPVHDKLGWDWLVPPELSPPSQPADEGWHNELCSWALHPRNPPGWDVTSNLPALRN